MNHFQNLSLTHFNIEQCFFIDKQVCDFSKLPRPFFIVSRWESDEAVYKSKTASINLKKGDIFFIPMGEKYVSNFKGKLPYCTSVFFTFSSSFSDKRYSLQKISFENQDEKDVFSNVFSFFTEKSNLSFSNLAQFYKMCDILFKKLTFTKSSKNISLIEPAINYINSHIEKSINIKELAKICHLSESHFYHTFKSLTGVTPITYKNRNAVNFAINMIKTHPELSIAEIGYKSGFSSDIYFRKVFKTYTGKTPKEFKNMDIM